VRASENNGIVEYWTKTYISHREHREHREKPEGRGQKSEVSKKQ
jgi:hypothetical protein